MNKCEPSTEAPVSTKTVIPKRVSVCLFLFSIGSNSLFVLNTIPLIFYAREDDIIRSSVCNDHVTKAFFNTDACFKRPMC